MHLATNKLIGQTINEKQRLVNWTVIIIYFVVKNYHIYLMVKKYLRFDFFQNCYPLGTKFCGVHQKTACTTALFPNTPV